MGKWDGWRSFAVVVVPVASACGSEATKTTRHGARPSTFAQLRTTGNLTPMRPASMFRPTVEPSGYRLAVAGRGGHVTELSSDSFGTVEPVIVLAHSRSVDALAGDTYTVSAVRYDGLEGRFAQASEGYVGRSQSRRVADKRALFTPPGRRRDGINVPIDLVVDFGHGGAVRVSGTKQPSEADLVKVAERAALDGRHRPTVAHPPGGLVTIARLNADQVAATKQPYVADTHGPVPGPPSGYTAAYLDPQSVGGPQSSIVFMSLPGSSSDPFAVALVRHADGDGSEQTTVKGKSAWLITHTYSAAVMSRSLVFVGPDGNLFTVSTSGDPSRIPSPAALRRTAGGVRPATATQWRELVQRSAH